MDVEALDRELIIERAEAVRFWLLGLPLTHRATGAIQRELGAIIDNDPGNYMNGQRPLAGLTIADFIAELHQPNGGAVGRVKSVGYAVLDELRAKIPTDAGAAQAEPETPDDSIDYSIPDIDAHVGASAAAAPVASADAPGPPVAAPASEAEAPAARRRGRPKGSTKAARSAAAQAAADAPRRPRGRPRREAAPLAVVAWPPEAPAPIASSGAPEAPAPAPAESPAAPLAPAGDDPLLSQIARLWPELHPQARRALVTYASELWVEH